MLSDKSSFNIASNAPEYPILDPVMKKGANGEKTDAKLLPQVAPSLAVAETKPFSEKSNPTKKEDAHSLKKGDNGRQAVSKPQVEAAPTKKSDEDELITKKDLSFYQTSAFGVVWHVVLGLSALLDFASFFFPSFFLPQVDEDDVDDGKRWFIPSFLQRKAKVEVVEEVEEEMWMDVFRWLEKFSVELGFLFSFLWFVDAFVKANRTRIMTLRQWDKDRLSSAEQQEISKSIRFIDETGLGSAWGVYIFRLFVELIMLPVGFYLFMVHVFRHFASGGADDEIEETLEFVYKDDDGITDVYETLTTKTQHCLGVALFQHLVLITNQKAVLALKAKIKSLVVRFSKVAFKKAIRNPRKFRRDMKKALTVLRWAKYLAPLIGACNKLLGNTLDLLKKAKQHREAEKAKRAREKIWKKLSVQDRQKAAAILIQSNFRAHQSRKAFEALKLIAGDRETLAALKIERKMRALAARARARVLKNKKELKELQDRERSMMKNNKGHLCTNDRRRMYELQDDLKTDYKEIVTKKMLLRPNTTFAVTWKVLFVVCITIEIAQLALKPQLLEYKDSSGNVMDLDKVLHDKLVPRPFLEWEQCGGLSQVELKKQQKRRIAQKPQIEKQGGEDIGTNIPLDAPWYCHKPYPKVQAAYIDALRFLITDSLVLVGIICFLDVFVTFFTGEIHPANGVLIPKPFFTRWILPGLTLQLLVNPKMAEISAWVKNLIKGATHVGPIRAWRWTRALLIPILILMASWLEHRVWRPLVRKQNASLLKR